MHRMVLTAASALALALVAAPAASADPSCTSPGGLIAKTCIDRTGSCTVGQYRTTPAGTGYYCLVRRPSGPPSIPAPCATQRSLFDKLGIALSNQEQVDWLYSELCARTG